MPPRAPRSPARSRRSPRSRWGSTASPAGEALIQLYQSARRAVLDSALQFNPKIETIRTDFLEIRQR
jgi:hypothetical protein